MRKDHIIRKDVLQKPFQRMTTKDACLFYEEIGENNSRGLYNTILCCKRTTKRSTSKNC